jgi:transposase
MEGAEQFYRDLRAPGIEARIAMEANGHSRWFERLIWELRFELRVGDAAAISSKRVRKRLNLT